MSDADRFRDQQLRQALSALMAEHGDAVVIAAALAVQQQRADAGLPHTPPAPNAGTSTRE